MPGVTPKHPDARVRRNRTAGLTQLPPEGRKGRVPAWPLLDDVSTVVKLEAAERSVARYEQMSETATPAKKRTALANLEKSQLRVEEFKALIEAQASVERQLWREVWKTPQATQWEKLKWTRDIAQYVRHKARAETGSVEDAKEARQWADRLGLTPLSLLRLRWEIQGGPAARAARSAGSASRARRGPLVAVPDLDPTTPGETG